MQTSLYILNIESMRHLSHVDGEVLAGVSQEKQYKLIVALVVYIKMSLCEAWNNAVLRQLSKIRHLN